MIFMNATVQRRALKVADEVWIATALLHRENPERADFAPKEIEQRAEQENITGTLRPGVYVHALLHCVANLAPNPGRYRMLFETRHGRRRLFRAGDIAHPRRQGAKAVPHEEEIPAQYRELLEWYARWSGTNVASDPLLALAGSGRAIWRDERADDYVRRVREGWE